MALAAQGVVLAFSQVGVCAASPNHPDTWVIGADKVHQALRWDAATHTLFADVKYSTGNYADDTHPTKVDDFALAFPTVQFDAQSGTFTANGQAIGTLRHGLFGSEVALKPGVALDIHRHHGKVYGRIISGVEEE
jgi:hypothetical protein